MDKNKALSLIKRNFLFWLSRVSNYPFVEPDMLQLCFTFKCNLKCKMCNVHNKEAELKRYGQPYELTFNLMQDLILQAHNMRVKEVYLVGGEPFIDENIFDLIRYASSLRMRTTVNTNGVLLDDRKINRVFDSGLSCLTFSIDGPDEESYKEIRGENIFKKTVSNLENLISKRKEKRLSNPKVTILCTVMKQNIRKLPGMVSFAKNIGVDNLSFQPVVADNTDQSCKAISDTWITQDMYNDLDNAVDNLIELKSNGFSSFISSSFEQMRLMKLYFRGKMPMVRKCYIGFNRIMVTQNYRVYFCVSDPQTGDASFGDVSKTPLWKLWHSKEAMRFRRQIKECKRPCLLFCSYRGEFDTISDRFNKIISKLKFIASSK